MGGNGQPAGHGARTAPPRGTTSAANSKNSVVQQLQALAAKSGAQADATLTATLQNLIQKTNITNPRLDPGDTQKFFVALGLADNKPQIVDDENALEAQINAGEQSKDYPYYIFHSDAAPDKLTGREFAGQLMGNDTWYASAGRLGDGTYFSTSPRGSMGYMNANGLQIKGMYNNNAKVISAVDLTKKIQAWVRSHPQAAAFIYSLKGSKGDSWGKSGKMGIFATLFGYNVVTDGYGDKTDDHYSACFDRSVMTLVKKTIGQQKGRRAYWKYQNPGEL